MVRSFIELPGSVSCRVTGFSVGVGTRMPTHSDYSDLTCWSRVLALRVHDHNETRRDEPLSRRDLAGVYANKLERTTEHDYGSGG